MSLLASSSSRSVLAKQCQQRPASVSIARVTASTSGRRLVELANASPLTRTAGRRIECRAQTTTAKPAPTVRIDNVSDAFATLVTVDLGDNIGEMFDTIVALKNLGLNIRRAKIAQKSNNLVQNAFYITEASTSEKIVKSARLEEIRMTVLDSVTAKFPESAFGFNFGQSSGYDSDSNTPGTMRAVVPTTIDVAEAANGSCSLLKIKTADRPGLLVDIVRVLKDVNLNVVSAEVDTIGAEAQDEFFVTYQGEPLTTPMVTLVTNALQYYLALSEVAKEESY